MDAITQRAFFSELEKIGASPLRFLGSGYKTLGNLMTGAPTALSRGAQQAGGHMNFMKKIWNAGADKAVQNNGSRFFGGLGSLARSQYGQVAGAVATPLAAGYAAHKMTS